MVRICDISNPMSGFYIELTGLSPIEAKPRVSVQKGGRKTFNKSKPIEA